MLLPTSQQQPVDRTGQRTGTGARLHALYKVDARELW